MCIGKREGLVDKETGEPIEGASRAFIARSKPDFKRKVKETDNFKIAKLHCQRIFPMMKACSLRNKAIKQLESIDSFSALFAPMAEFIMIKAVQMEKMCEEASEAVRLMDELTKCTNPAAIPDLLDRIKLASLDAPMLAFEGQDDADRKWLATTFSDEWTGCMGGWFRSYYICAHGCKWNGQKPVFHDGCCCTVSPSKAWDRKHADPMAPRQSYYCHQWHKHNASWGQLIEMRTLSGNMLYAWAQVPGCHIQDIRALKIEAECPKMSADDIFASLPVIPPQVQTGFITANEVANRGLPQPSYFSVDPDFFNSLEEFKWHQIFNMTGAPMQEVQATGKDAKKKAEWSKHEEEVKLRARITARRGSATSSLQP
jgi:hypothetical protein